MFNIADKCLTYQIIPEILAFLNVILETFISCPKLLSHHDTPRPVHVRHRLCEAPFLACNNLQVAN